MQSDPRAFWLLHSVNKLNPSRICSSVRTSQYASLFFWSKRSLIMILRLSWNIPCALEWIAYLFQVITLWDLTQPILPSFASSLSIIQPVGVWSFSICSAHNASSMHLSMMEAIDSQDHIGRSSFHLQQTLILPIRQSSQHDSILFSPCVSHRTW